MKQRWTPDQHNIAKKVDRHIYFNLWMPRGSWHSWHERGSFTQGLKIIKAAAKLRKVFANAVYETLYG